MGKILLAAVAVAGFLLFSDIMAWLTKPDENVTTIAKTPAKKVHLCDDLIECSMTLMGGDDIYSLTEEEDDAAYEEDAACIDDDGKVTDCPGAAESYDPEIDALVRDIEAGNLTADEIDRRLDEIISK